jgi:ubiquinone/menaquinone biosynthesis C-methylase UbiE
MKKNLKKLRNQLLHKTALIYSLARSGNFALQGLALPYVDLVATGKKRESPKEYTAHLQEALLKIKKLHEKDLENIKNEVYPLEVLWPENPLKHALRYPQVLLDSFQASRRRKQNISNEFNQEAQDYLANMPDYYKRNFHFQTSGYLSETSAHLYEHQVEILFSGAADAMRRLILPLLKVHTLGSDGSGLHFLEIASGTGRLTRFLALAFPKAKLTCVDLSPVYLAKARERLKEFKNINYVQAPAENLPFKDETFDAVVSCFLFHELPMEVRKQVLSESIRVIKSQALVGVVDSIQMNDDLDFEWALKQFPIDFHEPFYKNYVQNPLEDLWTQAGLVNLSKEVEFLSKVVSAVKV